MHTCACAAAVRRPPGTSGADAQAAITYGIVRSSEHAQRNAAAHRHQRQLRLTEVSSSPAHNFCRWLTRGWTCGAAWWSGTRPRARRPQPATLLWAAPRTRQCWPARRQRTRATPLAGSSRRRPWRGGRRRRRPRCMRRSWATRPCSTHGPCTGVRRWWRPIALLQAAHAERAETCVRRPCPHLLTAD